MAVSTQTSRIFTPGAEPIDSAIQECPGCATRLDLSRYEPLQEIACPVCEGRITVKGHIDRFALEAISGKGGTGMVYKAFDPHLGRHIALKVVREDKAANEEVLQQMLAEAGVTASINHPNVVRVFSVGNSNGRFFMAMELVAGGTLDDLMEKKGKLPEAQVLDIAIQVASGLQAAQQVGLVHRDIKPGNILFSDPKTAKVVDFGLSVLEEGGAKTGEVWGTPYYMPPERLEGEAEDFRADIYALGATLFHAITGRPPFEAANSAQVALKRLSVAAPSVLTYAPNVSNSTAFVIKKMMERHAGERFQSYEELLESLQFARNEIGAKPVAVKARVVVDAEQTGKTGMVVTLASLGVLVIGCITGYFLFRSPSDPAPAGGAPAADKAGAASIAAPKTTAPISGPVKAGVYHIVNRKTGLLLDCENRTMASGGNVVLWGKMDSNHQRWLVKNANDGTSRLFAYHSMRCLDLRGGSGDNNAPISQWTPNTGKAQQWTFREVQPGYFAIFSTAGKALSALEDRPEGGNLIGQREYSGADHQQWKFEQVGNPTPEWDSFDPVLNPAPIYPSPVSVRTATGTPSPRYVQLDIAGVASGDSRKGLFGDPNDMRGAVQPQLRGFVDVAGVQFNVLDPAKTPRGKDHLTLKGGQGNAKSYPSKLEVPVGKVSLSRLHFIGGVGGWCFPWSNSGDNFLGAQVAKVTVVHQGGARQEILLRNGHEFVDHVMKDTETKVTGSAWIQGFANQGNQLRYFAKAVLDPAPVEKLVFESFDNNFAPTFLAITGEKK